MIKDFLLLEIEFLVYDEFNVVLTSRIDSFFKKKDFEMFFRKIC